MIDFGREICGNAASAADREWLVTNGIGGYASGTISGEMTRRYHGLLVAALQPPVGRTLMVAKLEEHAEYDGVTYPLSTNHLAPGELDPHGYLHIERFRLQGSIPVWTFACADALLEKRVWMEHHRNTVYVSYRVVRGLSPITLAVEPLVTYRASHDIVTATDWRLHLDARDDAVYVNPGGDAVPYSLTMPGARYEPAHEWTTPLFLAIDDERGVHPHESYIHAGRFTVTLRAGEMATFVASAERETLDPVQAYQRVVERERKLLQTAGAEQEPVAIRQLVLAADQFIVRRAFAGEPEGRSVIAGYHWFEDWGRDTMIALPGLTLVTGRPAIARRILATYASSVSQGMLPNRFPEDGSAPAYNTVDAAPWFFEAVRAYHEATSDTRFLAELFPVLDEMVAWHERGTRYGIQFDPADGLLRIGAEGAPLTWMDARMGDFVPTPRIGKPVEVSALWYNALRAMADFARLLGNDPDRYTNLADRLRDGFERFWNAQQGYCFDVIDGPDGHDLSLRPNQLLAVSLHHSPLTADRQQAVVDVCARRLLTSHGLRSLSRADSAYWGEYRGDLRQRDAAYHQGTVWSWLIGPFVSAHYRVYRDRGEARSFLEPLFLHLKNHGLGSVSEIFDAEPPYTGRGTIAQAWGVAEILRVWAETHP